jgi:hypothetical protein
MNLRTSVASGVLSFQTSRSRYKLSFCLVSRNLRFLVTEQIENERRRRTLFKGIGIGDFKVLIGTKDKVPLIAVKFG